MISPENVNLMEENIRRGSARLIASNSEEARYNISNLETVSKTGYFPFRNQVLGLINMTITEPNGATLLSKLVESARSLGIRNHTQAVYLLVIEFTGWLPEGRIKKFTPSFYFPIMFRTFEFNVNEGGTTYQIDAIEHSASGYQYLNDVLRDQITVTATSVGTFIDDFLKKLERSNEKLLNLDPDRVYADQYEIVFDQESGTDEWLKWRFEQLDDPLKINGINLVGNPDSGELEMQIPATNGSKISELIGMVLQLTKEYKQIPTDDGQFYRENGAAEPSTRSLDSFPVFFKVLTDVQFLKYDPLRGDYQKKITFFVKKHITPDLIIDGESYRNGITDRSVQTTRIRKLLSSGLMQKRYDYIYTGQNTEVLNLDMRFDRLYFLTTPIAKGLWGDANTQSSVRGRDEITTIARLKNRLVELNANINSIRNTSSRGVNSIRREQSNATDEIRRNFGLGTRDVISTVDNFFDGKVNESTNNADFTLQSLERERSELLAELNRSVAEYDTNYSVSAELIAHPVRFEPDVISQSDYWGPENDLEGGAIQFGVVKSNLENPADMLKIEMAIRGDPYWLGRPKNYFALNNSGPSRTQVADYTLGGNLFYLKVNLPTADENQEGRRKPQPDYQITAVYLVIDVISRFEGGEFKQYLNAVLDTATNAPIVGDVLDSDLGTVQDGVVSNVFRLNVENLAQQLEDSIRRLGT